MARPHCFLAVAIAALAWNILGDLSFLMQYRMDMAALGRARPDMARVYAQMPGWAWAMFAVAVGAGTLGALLLIARKALAVPVYTLSLAAIVILFAQNFLGTDMLAIEGWGALVVPMLIFAFGVAQLAYARTLRGKGILR